MDRTKEFKALRTEMKKGSGTSALVSEAPNVKVISTGIPTLDVALGIGGYPRGVIIEVFGRFSVGKTAMSILTMAEAHKRGGYTGIVNIESLFTQETWVDWATSLTPDFDPDRCLYWEGPANEAPEKYLKMVSSGGIDVAVFDSIGALSTENELKVDGSKQSHGQSQMVTQLTKQILRYSHAAECVPILLNQIRDGKTMAHIGYTPEDAPGGHGKNGLASIRIHLTPSFKDIKKIKQPDGSLMRPGFRVTAEIIKSKVSSPRRSAQWNYWNYPTLENGNRTGIDVFQASIDLVLQSGVVQMSGSWFKSPEFPDGQLQGLSKVSEFIRNNPDVLEKWQKELVAKEYSITGNIVEELIGDVKDGS